MHIGHLAQFEMINITFKCQNENICKKLTIFITIQHGFWFFRMLSCPCVCMSHYRLVQREKLNGYELHGCQSLESSIGIQSRRRR
jgi:hypothetical protein